MSLLLPDSHSTLTFPFLRKQNIQQPFQKAASSGCSIQHIQLLLQLSPLKVRKTPLSLPLLGFTWVLLKGRESGAGNAHPSMDGTK